MQFKRAYGTAPLYECSLVTPLLPIQNVSVTSGCLIPSLDEVALYKSDEG